MQVKKTDFVLQENQDAVKRLSVSSYANTPSASDGVRLQNKPVSLLFAGDVMLDRSVREIAGRHGVEWLTKDMRETFLEKDMNIFNLEGLVTTHASLSVGTKMGSVENYIFTFDPTITREFLAKNHFSVVSIGNNHITNFGKEGVQETRNFLQENGVGFFGDPFDAGNTAYKTSVRGQKIALVNYNAFSSISAEQAIDTVRKEGTLGYKVFVYCHWGVEYALRENEKQRALAHAFIDAGADAVIGSHPHVVEPIEVYKGKAIFYSLGNFVFDQYFSDDTREGLLLGVEAGDEGMQFTLVPIWTEKDGRVRLPVDPYRRKLLERIAGDSTVEESIRLGIQGGYFSIK